MKTIFSKKLLIGVLGLCLLMGNGQIFAEIIDFRGSVPVYSGKINKKLEMQKVPQKEEKAPIKKSLNISESKAVKQCYDEYLMSEPSIIEGHVLFQWRLSSEGYVDDISIVQSSFDDDIFTGCLEEAIIKTQFTVTPDREGVLIAHKFRFERDIPAELVY